MLEKTTSSSARHAEARFWEAYRYLSSPRWLKLARNPARAVRSGLFQRMGNDRTEPAYVGRTFIGLPFYGFAGDPISRSIAGSGLFEPELTLAILRTLSPGDVFLDVGAHLGYFAQLAAFCVGEQGCVVAFDPSMGTASVRSRNLTELAIVRQVRSAVGEHQGTAEYFEYSASRSGFSFVSYGASRLETDESPAVQYEVPVVTIDRFCETEELHPSMIKIDAEGSERAILAGAMGILRSHHPAIAIEIGDIGVPRGHSADLVRNLRSLGYLPFEPTLSGLIPHEVRSDYPGHGNLIFLFGRHEV